MTKEQVKEERKRLGLSQEKLAQLIRVSSTAICRIERGTLRITPPMLKRLEQVFK